MVFAIDHETEVTIVGIVGPLCVMVGVIVTAVFSVKGNSRGKKIQKQVTRNGHSGALPDDEDSSADAIMKQVSYLGTKIDDHSQATATRFDTIDGRQLELEKQLNEFRTGVGWAFTQHNKQHSKEWRVQHEKDKAQELEILRLQGRLPDDDPSDDHS